MSRQNRFAFAFGVVAVGSIILGSTLIWAFARYRNQVRQYYSNLFGEVEKNKVYLRTLEEARPSAPYIGDFVRLFPESKVNSSFSMPGFQVSADLHGRYELDMVLRARFDSSGRKVIGYGDAKFYLREAASVGGNATSYRVAGATNFGPTEWQRIVESKGDFSAIGYTMLTNHPVPGFQGRNNP